MQYQFSDLDKYLTDQKEEFLRDTMRDELKQIIIEKRRIDNPSRSDD